MTRERLSRLLSPNVAERVISGEFDVKPGGTRTDCTVFNSDIRGFTHMSEAAAPEEIVEMLNDYFERMVETIFKYEGTLDKFMGDGIMAYFGAPLAQPDHAERACRAAVDMVGRLEDLNRSRVVRGMPPLRMGIGIHTGLVVLGDIGAQGRRDCTAIGSVRIPSHLEH